VLQPRSTITGGLVYRLGLIKPLENVMLFGELFSCNIFYIEADKLPSGGQESIYRIMLNDQGDLKTFL
jgi:hypothetical protein